jgi:hypothetical protein
MPGDSPDAEVGLAVLRARLAARLETASLRQVARDVGMTPSGLRHVLDGGRPQSATRRKLEAWYVRERELSPEAPDAETLRAALRLLVRELPAAERPDALRRLIQLEKTLHREAGRRPPEWLEETWDAAANGRSE